MELPLGVCLPDIEAGDERSTVHILAIATLPSSGSSTCNLPPFPVIIPVYIEVLSSDLTASSHTTFREQLNTGRNQHAIDLMSSKLGARLTPNLEAMIDTAYRACILELLYAQKPQLPRVHWLSRKESDLNVYVLKAGSSTWHKIEANCGTQYWAHKDWLQRDTKVFQDYLESHIIRIWIAKDDTTGAWWLRTKSDRMT